MKKYLSLLVLLGFLGFSIAKAETVYMFQDGTGFDPAFSTTVPRYGFLQNGDGWDYKLNEATSLSKVLGIDTQSPVLASPTPTSIVVTNPFTTPVVPIVIPPVVTDIPLATSTPASNQAVIPDCTISLDDYNAQVNEWVSELYAERTPYQESTVWDSPWQQITKKYNDKINKLLGQYQTERGDGCLVNGAQGVIGGN
jgi:hypothetical protein